VLLSRSTDPGSGANDSLIVLKAGSVVL